MVDDRRAAADRLAEVNTEIARACRTAGRNSSDVALIAVSKTFEADAIKPLIEAGQRRFGENRVQEAMAKWPALTEATPGIELHLVGQLQSNKAKEAVALFHCIQSLDRPSLVTALARACEASGKQPKLLIQVNIGDEVQKGGCSIADTAGLLAQAREAGLTVDGLMAVPPMGLDPAPFFALLAKMTRDMGLAECSMGMSGDFAQAVQLGATMVRVGSALMGPRSRDELGN